MNNNQTKNQEKQTNKNRKPRNRKPKSVQKMEEKGPAQKRGNYGRRNKVKDKNRPGKLEKVVFQSVNGREASTTRENIMVVATCVPKAVEAAFCALATRAFIFGANTEPSSPVYFAYVAFMKDLLQIMSSEIPASSARLDYLNDILGTYTPKAIPFKTDAELTYSWGNIQTVQNDANSISVRGYNYYFYVDDATIVGNWNQQSAPLSPSTDAAAFDKLAEVYSLLAKHTKGLVFDPTHTELTNKYRKDVSGFAACAQYYGSGNGDNGPAFSCEEEVPFLAPLLSGIATYDKTRIARNFKLTAGDTTTAFGLPFVPGFDSKFYNTCYAPIYKFIDLDEFVFLIQEYYISLVAAYVNSVESKATAYGDVLQLALSPFMYSPDAFRVFWRQIILTMFASSQACAQFITYSGDNNGFEPLRVSSNTYPPNTTTALLPSFIIENLRMLQPKVASIKTKFQNEKNALIYIPVFGVYKSTPAYNPYGTFFKTDEGNNYSPYESTICIGSESVYPRIIDGLGQGGEVLSMNGSLLEGFIYEWNTRINALKTASAATAMIGGSSNGSLLTLTRYAYYNEGELVMNNIPKWRRAHFKNKHIIERTKEFRRTPSQKISTIEKELVYVPSDYDLYSQRTSAISSLNPITEEVKLLCQYMVLPSITLEGGNVPPLQRQMRVLNLEGNVWDWNRSPGLGFVARVNELDAFAGICAPGLAAQSSDEVQNAINHMNTVGQGGFVGEALTEVAKFLLPMIPF